MTSFSRVAIVGVGLIGGSLSLALREKRLADTVVGVGRSRQTLTRARDLGAIDEAAADLAEGVAGADLVVLATPVGQILADLARLGPLLAPGALVTDVGSTKAEIVRAAGEANRFSFVGGHPMAGGERSGVEAARSDLFKDATWALTPTKGTNEDALRRVERLVGAVGARPLLLDPNAHDRAVALTSHLPHVLAYALAARAEQQARDTPRLLDLAAGSWAGATRVAHSPPVLWQNIALTNRAALADAVRALSADLDEVLTALESADADTLLRLFTRGHDAKKNASG